MTIIQIYVNIRYGGERNNIMIKAKRISKQEFLDVYSREDNIQSIARRLNLTPEYVVVRAYSLRKQNPSIVRPSLKLNQPVKNGWRRPLSSIRTLVAR